MINLLALFVIVPFLMYFSKCLNPIEKQLAQPGELTYRNMRMDTYLWIAIILLTCFSFLRTAYNDTENYIWMFLTGPSLKEGYESCVFFVIQMEDVWYFTPNMDTHPEFVSRYNSLIYK